MYACWNPPARAPECVRDSRSVRVARNCFEEDCQGEAILSERQQTRQANFFNQRPPRRHAIRSYT